MTHSDKLIINMQDFRASEVSSLEFVCVLEASVFHYTVICILDYAFPKNRLKNSNIR